MPKSRTIKVKFSPNRPQAQSVRPNILRHQGGKPSQQKLDKIRG